MIGGIKLARLIDKAVFIISLDVELLWGLSPFIPTDNKYLSSLADDPERGRGAVDFLLSAFEKYDIPATWAMVGHLFLDHCSEDEGIAHRTMPRFRNDWYNRDPCTNVATDPWYYGKDIVEKVTSNPIKHEIGYHSFSHVPFSECSREVAEAEIKEGIKVASELGIVLRSFVFPINLVGHVDVLRENGFEIYRGAHAIAWGSKPGGHPILKILGLHNLLIAPPVEPRYEDGIWETDSSTIFIHFGFPFSLLVSRTKIGIYWAIRSKKIFHLYLHPHNFVAWPSLAGNLDKLLAFVAAKRDEGKIEVMTMGGLASYLNEKMSVTKNA